MFVKTEDTINRLEETLSAVCEELHYRKTLEKNIIRVVGKLIQALRLTGNEGFHCCVGPFNPEGHPKYEQPSAFQLAVQDREYMTNGVMAVFWITDKTSGRITAEFPYHVGFNLVTQWIASGPDMEEAQFIGAILACMRKGDQNQIISTNPACNVVSKHVLPLLKGKCVKS